MLKFRSFRARILALFLILLAIVQSAVFVAVNRANINSATAQIESALAVTAGVLRQIVHERNRSLVESAKVMSGDYAFKQAIATHDQGTIISVLNNHKARIGADVMLLVSFDVDIIADTLHPNQAGGRFHDERIIKSAESNERGEAASIVMIDGKAYQMAVVPLLIPAPEAWVLVGFDVNEVFAKELERLTQSQISFAVSESGKPGWEVFASTLPAQPRKTLPPLLNDKTLVAGKGATIVMDGVEHVSFVVSLLDTNQAKVSVILQRPLADALAPYFRLRIVLAALFIVGLAFFALGGNFLAGTVTRPVNKLVRMSRKVEEGDYTVSVEIAQKDELGKLGAAFNNMVKGLAERDRVQNILGKVVSVAVAEELLSKGYDLGGEDKEVTVLFTDLRDFTTLSEKHTAREILSILNVYFTGITSVVEASGGVVDKYIGDAMMALFGAPLTHKDDAEQAVAAALEMIKTLGRINEEFVARGFQKLEMGVGINTAMVLAGNMGSKTRLNYTVIGDGVNLASRIEGLCKKYGVAVLVSGTTREKAHSFVYREIDRVRVKGKTEPVVIYEPAGKSGEMDPAALEMVNTHNSAIELYRARRWDEAKNIFSGICGNALANPKLCSLYLERIDGHMANPPGEDWSGISDLREK
ncbi:MAG: HAMP domain-containing protein [Nitrospinae bacterium]|nr:HAMP domain-containing protein [Nitrospinota bacterium]